VSVLCPFKTDIKGAVPAAELSRYLAKLRDEEIDMEADDKQLLITSKKGEAGITMQADVSLPLEEADAEDKWKKLPEDFCQGITFCSFCASRDMSKLVLTCLNIGGDHIISCDNLRVMKYSMKGEIKQKFLLPNSAAVILVRYKPEKYSVGKGWIHFLNEAGIRFSCRTVNAEYPDVERVLEVEGKEVSLPKTMDEILEEVEVFSKSEFEQDESVTVMVEENKLTVEAEGDTGWARHSKRIKYSGKIIKFQVHPSFLLQASTLMDTMIVGKEKLRINGENFIHVACLKG